MTEPGKPLAVGDLVHGYAQGVFGRDHYACARVEAFGADWAVVRGVSTERAAAATGDDVVEVLTEARDFGRADWCRDSDGCGEDPAIDRDERIRRRPELAYNPYEGTDLWRLAPGMQLVEQIRYTGVASPDGLAWLLPAAVLPGVTGAYGLPIVRIEGPGLYLGHRLEEVRGR